MEYFISVFAAAGFVVGKCCDFAKILNFEGDSGEFMDTATRSVHFAQIT